MTEAEIAQQDGKNVAQEERELGQFDANSWEENVKRDKLIENNAAGKVRGEVRKVLELQCPQIREYLERETPNINGALSALAYIEKIVENWDKERK